MQTRTVKYAIGALLGLALLACDRGGEAFDGEQPFALKETCLHIDLNFAGEAPSKAATPDTPEVEGQDWENDIQTLSVFVRNIHDNVWAWDTIVRLYNVQKGKDYEVRLNKPLTASTKLYAAANISTAQETAFMQQVDNGNSYYDLPGNDFRLVEDLAPYSNSATARRNTIAMCCTGAAQAQATEGEEDNHFSVEFTLKRLVAKVLVTCEETNVQGGDDNVKYAPVKENLGWIRLDSLRYALNGLNRKTYILQQIDKDKTDTDANVTDPNPDLTDFPTEESTLNNFYSFPLGRTGKEGEYEKVLPFNSQKNYYEGIYCPENTFYPEDTFEEGQWMMITHVVISAVFTPKVLQVEYGLFDYIEKKSNLPEEQKTALLALKPTEIPEGKDIVEVTCQTEETAQLLLTESLRQASRLLDMDKSHTDAERFFKEASYFYYKRDEQFYTYGATMSALNIEEGNGLELDDLEEFGNYVPYNGGQGYYYTYIDNRHPDKKQGESFAFYKHGQVERNRYYILTIKSFSNPGASFTNPDYIEVHTRTLNWENGGTGTTEPLGPGTTINQTRRQP